MPPSSGISKKKSGKVAPRPCETLDPAARHGIAFQVDAYDRDRARCTHHGTDRIWGCSQNDAAFEGNKLAGEFVNPVEHAAVKSCL